MSRPMIAGVLLAAGLLFPASVRQGAPAGKPSPDILIVTIDTLRADHLKTYGYPLDTDPNIRRAAQEGVVFEDASTVAPLTLPAHLSLLTGLYPLAHGVRDNDQFWTGEDPTLAELLRSRGYQTAAFVSSFVLSSRFGLGKGFDLYDDQFAESAEGDSTTIERPAQRTVHNVLRWLKERDRSKPFFLWLHLFEPHRPYDPPPPFAGRFASPYDGEIAAADAALGELFDELRRQGRWKGALVALASDHGEGLGEHDESTHGYFAYQSTLRVPLIFKLPEGRRAGAKSDRPVSLVDVAPTALRLAGAPVPSRMQGRFLDELTGAGSAARRAEAAARTLYAESYTFQLHYNWSGLRVLRRGPWKLIDSPLPELFDLSRDPGELNNLFAQDRTRGQALQAELQALEKRYSAPMANLPGPSPDPETMDKLRSLGYSALSAPGPVSADPSLPDPKQRLEIFRRVKEAERLLQVRPDAAIEELKALRDQEPRLLRARELLTVALGDAGRWEEAAAELEALEKLLPLSYKVAARLAVAYEKLEKPALALGVLDRALDLDPDNPYLQFNRARLQEQLGQTESAQRSYEMAVQLLPAYPQARYNLGQMLFRQRRPQEALVQYRAAAEADPQWKEAHNNAGLCLALLGRLEEAIAVWRTALQIDPSYRAARSNLAQALQDLGREREAEEQRELLRRLEKTPR